MILTSCNTYIKPGETRNIPEKPNDTLFLAEAYGYSKLVQDVANIASIKASDQKIRIFAEKVALFHQRSGQVWDSLSRKLNISISENILTDAQKKELKKLKSASSDNFDQMFMIQMEKQLMKQIGLLENVSKSSEDNEITTVAITLLPDIGSLLDSLVSVRNKIAVK